MDIGDLVAQLAPALSEKAARDNPGVLTKPGLVVSVDNDASKPVIWVTVKPAGSDTPITATSLIGSPVVGSWVMMLWSPPSGWYVIGALTGAAVPAGRLRLDGVQPIPYSTLTLVGFNVTDWTVGGMTAQTGGDAYLMVPRDGIYSVRGQIIWDVIGRRSTVPVVTYDQTSVGQLYDPDPAVNYNAAWPGTPVEFNFFENTGDAAGFDWMPSNAYSPPITALSANFYGTALFRASLSLVNNSGADIVMGLRIDRNGITVPRSERAVFIPDGQIATLTTEVKWMSVGAGSAFSDLFEPVLWTVSGGGGGPVNIWVEPVNSMNTGVFTGQRLDFPQYQTMVARFDSSDNFVEWVAGSQGFDVSCAANPAFYAAAGDHLRLYVYHGDIAETFTDDGANGVYVTSSQTWNAGQLSPPGFGVVSEPVPLASELACHWVTEGGRPPVGVGGGGEE